MKLSIIIVNYNARDHLVKTLSLLYKSLKRISSEIYVVDNNSTNFSAKTLQQKFPKLHIIVNKKNIGFSAACNLAFIQTKGKYVLFLNPDVFVQPNTISLLVSYMDTNPAVGITSCKLFNQEGTLQYSCRAFPSVFQQLFNRIVPSAAIVSNYLLRNRDHTVLFDVDWLLGAFLLIRRKTLEDIGSFDERFFLYFEDVDFCYRAKQAGWRVVYNPKAVATHLYKQASKKLFSKPQLYHLQSMVLYYNKHGWRFI